jgi:hypothetical protein
VTGSGCMPSRAWPPIPVIRCSCSRLHGRAGRAG